MCYLPMLSVVRRFCVIKLARCTDIDRGKLKYSRKTCASGLLSTKYLHELPGVEPGPSRREARD